jgi:hypothetical protein
MTPAASDGASSFWSFRDVCELLATPPLDYRDGVEQIDGMVEILVGEALDRHPAMPRDAALAGALATVEAAIRQRPGFRPPLPRPPPDEPPPPDGRPTGRELARPVT